MTLIAFILLAAGIFPGEDPNLRAARIEQACITGSVATLAKARKALLEEIAALPPEKASVERHMLAYIDWRLSHIPKELGPIPAEPETLLEEAREQLEKLVRQEPSNAEVHALLGSVYGGQISLNPMSGMTLGSRVDEVLAKAAMLDPENPRVALQAAASAYYTPQQYGGGIDKAEEKLKQAEALFAKEPRQKPWPNWGRMDLLAWKGQILAARKDFAGARAVYERALALQPDYAWIRHVLLPALDKQAAKQRK